jgi:hypothetical protein
MKRVALLLAFVPAAGGVAAVAYATLSPKALRASIVDAAKAQQSVHYVQKNILGNALLTLTGDVATDHGIQHVKLVAGKQTGRITIYVVDQTAYVQGNAFGLHALQGLTKTQAAKYAGQWISIPKGDKLYAGTAAAVTLGSFVQSIAPRGRLKTFSAKAHGVRVVGVRGIFGKGKRRTLTAIDARAKGKKLPLEAEDFTPGEESIGHTAISKWNESVQVQAPSSSTPISTVRQS